MAAECEALISRLGLDVTKTRAVMDGFPEWVGKILDKRVGVKDAFREAVAGKVMPSDGEVY